MVKTGLRRQCDWMKVQVNFCLWPKESRSSIQLDLGHCTIRTMRALARSYSWYKQNQTQGGIEDDSLHIIIVNPRIQPISHFKLIIF